MQNSIGHYIGGDTIFPNESRTADVYNPATGEVTASVALADSATVAEVVRTAKAAFPAWAEASPLKRSRILNAFLRLLEENQERLAAAISREHGKTLPDALGEVQRGLEVVEFALGAPHLLKGEVTETVGSGVDSHSLRQPLGVVVGITPFNFPAMVPMWMFPIALACGNCFVLKPSERVPSASMLIAELLAAAGLPDGVFNVIHGDKEAVNALLEHPDVSAVSFVGSTPVAKHVYETSTRHGKRCQALGGAKNHMVIMPDADIDKAVDALMGAAYGSAGERCMAISVAVPVGKGTADALIERLAPRVRALKVGSGVDAETEMGPLITAQHRDRVRSYIDAGESEGAELVVDGRTLNFQGYENGFFVGGTLFDHVTPEMSIYRDEIFGPVLSVVRMPDYASATDLIRNNPYGNGTAIFTRDGDTAREFTHSIEVGMVGVNVPIPVPMAFHSFGGWKASLFGDHHMHGMEGIRFYTRLKTVTSRWPTGIRSGSDFVMPTLG